MGSVTLAVLLLHGCLNTRSETFRTSLRPAFVLETLGVLITCVVLGLFAAWLLDLGVLEGLLVGAVVGSTDAAALFALLRARGFRLKERVAATLEMESGSNDPVAVFLTIAVIELLVAEHRFPNLSILPLFVQQMGNRAGRRHRRRLRAGLADQPAVARTGDVPAPGARGRARDPCLDHGAGRQWISGDLSDRRRTQSPRAA